MLTRTFKFKHAVVTLSSAKSRITKEDRRKLFIISKSAAIAESYNLLRGLCKIDYTMDNITSHLRHLKKAARVHLLSPIGTNIDIKLRGFKPRNRYLLNQGAYANADGGIQFRVESPITSPHMAKLVSSELKKVLRDLQEIRNDNRRVKASPRVFTTQTGRTIRYNTILACPQLVANRTAYLSGGVFNEPGSILKIQEELKSSRVYDKKVPKNQEKHLAIEIEFGSPKSKREIGKLLFEANLAEYVQLKDDGSLRDFPAGHFTHELVVCMPVSNRYSIIKSVCDVLAAVDSKVNKTCGLHVHIDMRTHDRYKAFSNLVSAQNILYQMVPQSRRDNTYCKKTTSKDYHKARNTHNRYVGINPQSFSKHGTIEVRLHSGTTNYTKIINFVDILIAVAYNETKIVRAASTVAGFVKQHNLTSDIKSYIEQRIALFGSSSAVEESA